MAEKKATQNQNCKTKASRASRKRKEQLSFIPLGGLGEIGKNMYAVEYDNDIIVIDCGLMFAGQELPGIDYIVPDTSWLEANREKIQGFIITHGHEDHTGALPHVLPKLNVPVYATRLTFGFISNKFQEDLPTFVPNLHEIKAGEIIELGPFKVKFIAVAHSIPDGVALSIETPLGRIVHTGDFKLDSTPIDGRITDYGAFAEEGDKGVLLLTSDSTNAERQGFTPSERVISGTLDRLFREWRARRIIISSFASNIHRIQQVVDTARRFGRKIAFVGRSMLRLAEIARDLGYLKIDNHMIVQAEEIEHGRRISGNQVVIMTTGSQGESFSGLVTMSRGEHKMITLGERDVIFLLASMIPGNEKFINKMINQLFSLGCEVVYEQSRQVHVSGHASSEELKILLNLVRPTYFIPIHGEYRHMVRHSQLAQSVGIPPRNIFLMSNGDILTFTRGSKPKLCGQVKAGAILIDGNASGGIQSDVMQERRDLSEGGVLVIAAAIDDTGELLAPPAIEMKGVFISDNYQKFIDEVRAAAERGIHECQLIDPGEVARVVRIRVREVLRRQNVSYAIVLPTISIKKTDDNLTGEKKKQDEQQQNWIEL